MQTSVGVGQTSHSGHFGHSGQGVFVNVEVSEAVIDGVFVFGWYGVDVHVDFFFVDVGDGVFGVLDGSGVHVEVGVSVGFGVSVSVAVGVFVCVAVSVSVLVGSSVAVSV